MQILSKISGYVTANEFLFIYSCNLWKALTQKYIPLSTHPHEFSQPSQDLFGKSWTTPRGADVLADFNIQPIKPLRFPQHRGCVIKIYHYRADTRCSLRTGGQMDPFANLTFLFNDPACVLALSANIHHSFFPWSTAT